jgi:hypothetical protein
MVFGFTRVLDDRVAAGARVVLTGQIENRLVPGRHYLDAWIGQEAQESRRILQGLRLLDFVVFGVSADQGVVGLRTDVTPVLEDER